MNDSDHEQRRTFSRRVARRLTGMVRVAPFLRSDTRFHLSFAFDDCPDSACTRGIEILEERSLQATFFIATGLLGQDGVSGPITTPSRLRELAARGHEIALHTHAHGDLTHVPMAEAISDIERNIKALQDILGEPPSPHFAYPYGETTLTLKRALVPHVTTARGVRSGVNRAFADRMQLFACDLGSHRPDYVAAARRMMKHAATTGGWLVMFTHDVRPHPSPYGVTPEILESLLDDATALGAELLPVRDVWARLSG
ncbi:polysaccharide deacetylase family protein [Roseibaca sp. V10]|uniref:Chitooligosaccharide deacetylase n=1 Tax=Roseinatronobacter domitianus TaxID=2940293 RepID=A0ABT0M350_9RHOB|nr:polysaccharide deacetylase family protein [Roseibaca domitiana]MCL1629276.1 polysaccharide deacetylase family protein [Roseibaca domitiana]